MNTTDLLTPALQRACKDFNVQKLYAFGSVTRGALSSESDLDFLVEFNRKDYTGAFNQFIDFKQRLEEIYQRPVDLIHGEPFRNPVFSAEIKAQKVLLYAG
jgi:predicted nucleotidyltransferase